MQADQLIWYQNGQALYQSAEIHLYRSACQWISYRIQGLQFYQICRNNIICVLKPGIFHAAFAQCSSVPCVRVPVQLQFDELVNNANNYTSFSCDTSLPGGMHP